MVQKRQLAEEEYDVSLSSKHLKLENSCQLVSSLEFPSKGSPLKPCNSAEGCSGAPIQGQEHIPPKPRTFIQPEDTYVDLLHFPPLKEVPVGPEYQAEIPEWCGNYPENENKFIGSCVIQMPEPDKKIVKRGRSHCCCEDPGSVTCVRLHIREARENLVGEIGHERFSDLGFCSMGDVVASKWTEEDERLFHEVIYSNPISLGKNFWEHLSESFPSRTNREIVSYYFNVFVLQRRAEQNRRHPMNADSDDDEWQGSDEIRGSPVFDYDEDTRFQSSGDCDFQDDSCTSSDTGNYNYNHNQNLDFVFEDSDSREWDFGYFSIPRNEMETDFLPTGSMIEEVFGVESWNLDSKKGSR